MTKERKALFWLGLIIGTFLGGVIGTVLFAVISINRFSEDDTILKPNINDNEK